MRWHQSILPCRLQDQIMAKLHKELGKWLVGAGLQSVTATAQSLSRGRRCSWAHSSSQARSPSAAGRRKEVAKWPRGDSLSRRSQPSSRGHGSRVQQHQSQSPEYQQASEAPLQASTRPHKCTSLSPSPLHPHCIDEWLHHYLSKLHLQLQQQESRSRVSRMWPGSTLIHATGCLHSPPGSVRVCLSQGPTKKQVCFNLTKDLDKTLPLPADLACFLGDVTDEWIDGPCPPAPLSLSSLRWPSNGDHLCHDILMGEAWPKTHTTPLNKPMVAGQSRTRHSASPDLIGRPIY